MIKANTFITQIPYHKYTFVNFIAAATHHDEYLSTGKSEKAHTSCAGWPQFVDRIINMFDRGLCARIFPLACVMSPITNWPVAVLCGVGCWLRLLLLLHMYTLEWHHHYRIAWARQHSRTHTHSHTSWMLARSIDRTGGPRRDRSWPSWPFNLLSNAHWWAPEATRNKLRSRVFRFWRPTDRHRHTHTHTRNQT